MKSILLLLLILPLCSWSQNVKPVLSPDYLSLVKKDSIRKIESDTFNNVQSSLLTASNNYNGDKIGKIFIRNNRLIIKPYTTETLLVSGNFTSIAEIKTVNQTPKLQNQYVQGRSQNGNLVWQGPEKNELFSYGPDMNTVEYDGASYDYDHNGRLVLKGGGNGKIAEAYGNNILKNASFFSQSLSVQAKYKKNYRDFLTSWIKLGNANENSSIQYNRNNNQTLSTTLEAVTKIALVSGSFSFQSKNASNSNRNGFLNRVYQNSLLTPISFSNRQGSDLGPGQRSYSRYGDNPYFLLQNNPNNFHQNENITAITIERKQLPVRFRLAQSFEFLNESETNGYKPGTAFFENGIIVNQITHERNYCLQANAQQDIHYDNYYISSFAEINYILSNNNCTIEYRPRNNYNYQRTAHDAIASFATKYQRNRVEAYLKLENKVYTSNTTTKSYFLPAVSAFVRFNNFIDYRFSAKLIATYNHFNSELPVHQSFSQTSLLQYNTEDAFKFFPLTEVESFDQLKPIRHKESSIKAELNYQNKLTLNAELFQRTISDDVFPILTNNSLVLKNIAAHKNTGIELELNWNTYKKNFNYSSSLSFFKYKSEVLSVDAEYNNTAITGFKNIHKTIVEGQPLGVIVGKAFLRDANRNIIIGDDGFPVADPSLKIIGDPNPDFTMKFWNNLNWKRLSFNLGLEWKKGGDVWNGTEAVLDYYGRSKTSADLRNLTGYVFKGVTNSGHTNNKPVSFYDPSFDVSNNRWTRYGFGGIDENYIQRADLLRINNTSLSYLIKSHQIIQSILLSAYANNILIWTAHKSGDPSQLLYDVAGSSGLDFFNLPSLKHFGFSVTLQF